MSCPFSPQPEVHIPYQVRSCNLAKLLIIHDAPSDFLVAFRAVDKEVLLHSIENKFEITDSIDLSRHPEDFILNNNQVRAEYKSPFVAISFSRANNSNCTAAIRTIL